MSGQDGLPLVERLRAPYTMSMYGKEQNLYTAMRNTMHEAADEIDQLTKELEQAQGREKKLREAITVVLNNSEVEFNRCPACDHEDPVAGSDYTHILRAAISPQPQGQPQS